MKADDYFCEQIISGKSNIHILKETERILAFYHVKPVYTTHILIIPKQHILDITHVKDFSLISEIFQLANEIIEEKQLRGYTIKVGGGNRQYTKHLHFHLLSGKKLR